MRVLAVGDLHLGRRPSRLPPILDERARALGPTGAWRRVVATAIEHGVDVLVLAGDVVEREHDFFEAYRELHRGVSRLKDADIRVLGVAGNHDVAVLPRLADELLDFTLLGRDGHWQSVLLKTGSVDLTLHGWSFPARRVHQSPLAEHRFEPAPGVNLGVLHCDRDQAASAYAPVASQELAQSGLDGWLLGHIHRPDALAAPNPSGYLGCVTGMDPGEHGVRGPWLLTLAPGRIESVEQWPLAPLHWHRLELDIEGLTAPEAARERLLQRLDELDRTLSQAAWVPEAVGLRITLTGRSALGEAVRRLFSDNDREHLLSGARETHYFIERLDTATRPEIALEELARREDPPGLLARRMLLLARPEGDPERQDLIHAARARLQLQRSEARFSTLQLAPTESDAAVAATLERAGMHLLDALIAQRGDAA